MLLEFYRVGDYVKVSAIDPQTLVEVSAVGTPHMTKSELTQLAIRKLEYVLAKRGDDPDRSA